ncbi:MAG TPA: bifunctional phosphopantothenoylcysteine decarboxylase/phosphopantothenate--cysteine ligase CoaBC, partial [Actinobacteria bacterium]|nr:bifunctional phosphopantothenoylcysteine decarboxylase/phosphopantothenate--cysteine ligase CoaBC [Actinomycetota bacterium]
MSTTQRSVILGVSGGIAAYKVAQLLRLFTEGGFDVRVVPTHAALEFVGKATWEALSGHPIASDVWTDAHDVPHVMVGREADLVFVAPATADLMARAAHGLANDLLTNVLLTATCPIVLAPAMHTEMWENSATQANVATLRSRGVVVLDPDEGRLTGADSGKGRLPEPQALFEAAVATLQGNPADLAGKRVVVSAGGTREHIDPVRFLGNRSSGRQGFAVAAAAARRGAEVTLIAANVSLPTPAGVKRVDVVSAQDLHDEVMQYSIGADVVVMAAAVADFRPVVTTDVKIKKSGVPDPIALELTTDVLSALVERRTGEQVIIGFAAETGDADTSVLEFGKQKLAAKGCDVLVVNDVGPDGAFESATNEVYILDAE